MSEHLSPELERLLAAERAAPPAPAAAHKAVFERVADTVGLDTGATAAATASKTTLSAKLIVLGLVGLGVVALIVGVQSMRESEATAPPEPSAVDERDLAAQYRSESVEPFAHPAPTAAAGTPDELVATEVVPAEPEPRAEKPAKRGKKDHTLGAERRLLQKARAALTSGDTAGALAVLRRHKSSFARGELVEEREALWIQALVVAGHEDNARERAEAFRERYPRSIQLRVVEAALEQLQ